VRGKGKKEKKEARREKGRREEKDFITWGGDVQFENPFRWRRKPEETVTKTGKIREEAAGKSSRKGFISHGTKRHVRDRSLRGGKEAGSSFFSYGEDRICQGGYTE